MSISRVAFRNLKRNRIKTLLSIIAIVVGVAFFVRSECSGKGLRTSGFLNIINNESGAIQIYNKNYFSIKDELPLYESIYNYEKIETSLEDEYFTTSRVKFSGSIVSPEKQKQFTIIAIDPTKEKKIFSYPKDISPRNVENGAFQMVMGYRGAAELGVKVGDAVRLIADIEIKDGDRIKTITQLLDFTVVGLITSDNLLLSKYTAIVPLDILQDENGMMLNGAVTEIVVRDKNFNSDYMPTKKETVENVEKLIPNELMNDVVVKEWTQYDVDQMKTISKNELAPVFFFMTLLIIMLMSNTMLLSVMDRTREISLLRAMGMDNFEIFKLLAVEAGYLGIIGGAIGLVVGYLITVSSVHTGFELNTEFIEARDLSITVTGTIKSVWSVKGFVFAGIAAVLTSVISAVFPTLSALKMNIIKGIKHE